MTPATTAPSLATITVVAITLATIAVVALAAPYRPRPLRSLPPAGSPVRPPFGDRRGGRRHDHPHEALVANVLEELHLEVDPPTALAVLRCTSGLAVASALLIGGPAAAALVGAAVLAMPGVAGRVLARRATMRRDEQLAPMLERLAADVRAGSALGPALVGAAHLTPAPLGDDLRVVAAEVEHGAALSQALARWGDRADSGASIRMVVAALTVAAEAGGEVARSVDRLAATLRERRDLRAEVRSLATQARASAAVLVAAPLGFAALVAGIEPGAVTFLVSTPVGLLCLSAGLALDVLGATWMNRILGEGP